MSKKSEQLTSLVEGVLENFSSELYILNWEKRGGEWVLELLIEKEGTSITTTDCAEISNCVSEVLDERDLIQKEYVLQVSSPGVERPLVEARHFEGAVGGNVEVNTYGPINGSKRFTGILKCYNDKVGEIRLELKEESVDIPLDSISKGTTRMVDSDWS